MAGKSSGDWTCPYCQDFQFGRNSQCRKCGAAKPTATSYSTAAASHPAPHLGDWTCTSCSEYNFAKNDKCRKCWESRPSSSAAPAAAVAPPGGKPGDWICPTCDGLVFASRAECRKCGTSKPASKPVSVETPGSTSSAVPGGDSWCAQAASRPGDWMCPICNETVFASKSECRKCRSVRPRVESDSGGCSSGQMAKDWVCTSCAESNFGSRQSCRRCSSMRPPPAPPIVSSANGKERPGDWRCPKCQDLQFAKNAQCRSCGEPRPQWFGSHTSMEPPPYWMSTPDHRLATSPWCLLPVQPAEMEALRLGMVPGGTFGGRDHRTKMDYSRIVPCLAWRLQHFPLWGKYAMERESMSKHEAKSLTAAGIVIPQVTLRQAFSDMSTHLPAQLNSDINEVYLSHGSKPDILLSILSGGLNERFSGGLFGQGTYFAEDVAKNDQYCTADLKYGDHPELHKVLFDDLKLSHPGEPIFYVFICRVLLGHSIRTLDGNTSMDGGRRIWSSPQRELAAIPGSQPPLLHHSLIAETGGKLKRFREFIVFHGERIYPEYLVAYQRV
mmetsp:Transcript_66098/g.158113  ORF Transcript_66098/g.158113 Transcript_66098/m.158113 type:complete len:555 (+) Transcript_66098:63-1727(+)|eukprot:CAMPEP_0178409420 /NCGR_PEP_ID=MMETSP0689_2-20121128/20454_1 /TAXON_ID=160604 /ORGANISM="Amphidinium massartii, Strain CS-259" /LENGTH=554 /DNA_ID=CAMNT_0020030563 /DNA_START=1 /DNA_END=1665 /DNA_ORIENTATION=-